MDHQLDYGSWPRLKAQLKAPNTQKPRAVNVAVISFEPERQHIDATLAE
jgi:hypothetical protein